MANCLCINELINLQGEGLWLMIGIIIMWSVLSDCIVYSNYMLKSLLHIDNSKFQSWLLKSLHCLLDFKTCVYDLF